MELTEPVYRKNYIGEVITDNRKTPPERVFAKPRNLYFKENGQGKAIVIGNGKSRLNDKFNIMLNANNARPLPGYKLTYACNGAMWDLDCDYYVVTNRLLMGHIPDKKLINQCFLNWDMYLDYKKANLIPYLRTLDAGTFAAFLACFDGNNEVFLFGFDGDNGTENNNVYYGKPSYETLQMNANRWEQNLSKLIRTYRNVNFYRAGGNNSYKSLLNLHNYKELDYNSVVYAGDF